MTDHKNCVVCLQEGYEKGKVEALDALCTIFCSKSTTNYHPFYLASFYRGIEEVGYTQAMLVVLLLVHLSEA
jgi:hypothetical protein